MAIARPRILRQRSFLTRLDTVLYVRALKESKSTVLMLRSLASQLDIGATLVGLPIGVFNSYFELLPGYRVNPNNGLVLVPFDQVPRMGNMTFRIAGDDYVFTPSAQLFPPEISTLLLGGLTPEDLGGYLSVFANTGFDTQDSFTLGMYWLERCKLVALRQHFQLESHIFSPDATHLRLNSL